MANKEAVNTEIAYSNNNSNLKPASLDVDMDKNPLPDNVCVSPLVNSAPLVTSQAVTSCQSVMTTSTTMTSQVPTCTLTPITTVTSMGEESQAALLFLLNSSCVSSQAETTTSYSGLSSFDNAVFVPQPLTISVMAQGQNSFPKVTNSDGSNVIEKAMDLANLEEMSSDGSIQHPVTNAALTLVSLGNAVGQPVQEIVIDESGRSTLSHDSNLGEVSVTVESEGPSQMSTKSQVCGCTVVATASGIRSEESVDDKSELRTQIREISTQTGAGEKEVVVLKAMKKPVSKSSSTRSLVDQSLERKRLAELKEAQKDVAEKERTHPCDKCDKKFFTKHDLKRHSLVHSEVRPYECQVCKKAFRTPNELKLHLPVHNTDTPYKCEFCGKEFRTKGCIKSHIKYHIGDKRHKCATCGRAFVKSADLKRHVAAHNNEKKFKCSECGSMFTRRDNLKAHMLLHTRKSVVTCKMCNKEFINEVYLKRHMHIHKQAKKKPYECQWCPKTYEQLEGLRRHIRQHVGDEKFVCEHCAKKFITAIQLKRHLWLSHEQNSPYRKSIS